METIKLQHSDLTVSRVCMGGCPMGGYGWGQTCEADLIRAVQAALDQGVTFFDTADTYGLGQSERTLGKALAGRRHKAVIATKFGVRAGGGKTVYDNSPQWIRTACEASLQRLGTDYLDLYQIHYLDGVTPLEEVVATLEELQQKGMIRYFGLSNIHRRELPLLEPFAGKFVSFQDEYSLACRKNEADIRELSQSLKLSPLTWGSLGQGVLTGKYDKDASFGADDRRSRAAYVNFHGEKLLKNLEIADLLKQIARAHQKPVPAVAVRYILDSLPGAAALCGAKNPQQITDVIQAADWHLSPQEQTALEQISR